MLFAECVLLYGSHQAEGRFVTLQELTRRHWAYSVSGNELTDRGYENDWSSIIVRSSEAFREFMRRTLILPGEQE